MNNIGIMQGRLTPPAEGKIQSFPWGFWEDEFRIASEIGFDEIEFIFDADDFQNNPLFSAEGLEKMRKITDATGVRVNYVCADYFMEHPFFRVSEDDKKRSEEILEKIIMHCAKIGIKGIEIPLVDDSEIRNEKEKKQLISALKRCLPTAEENGIYLGLETSLDPEDFRNLLDEIDHPNIFANYDTGNSAALGYDTEEEIFKLGKWVKNIHIKDRVFKGGTVPLGEGNADFEKFFKTLSRISYEGSFILQAARGSDEIETVNKYLSFVKEYISKYMEKKNGP